MDQDRDPEGASLGKYASKDATPGQSVDIGIGFAEPAGVPGASRRAALALRERLWSVSSIERVRKCGKVPRGQYLPLVAAPGAGHRLTGLCTCGSVWVCPLCAPEIRAARGNEIAGAVARQLGDGAGVSFGTGTLSHSGRHSLRSTYGLVVKSWGSTRQDGSVRRFRKAHGYIGFIRTTEMTHGVNGWHPHVHWLDFWERALSPQLLAEYQSVLYGAWSRAVHRGDRYASPGNGLLVLPVTADDGSKLGDYMTNMSVESASFELTSISTKKARNAGGLAPFEILAKVYGPTSKPWVDLWWEYEKATQGRRMLGTTRGILDSLGLREEDPEPREIGEVVAYVSAEDWGKIRWFTRTGLAGVQAILEHAAAGGQLAVNEAIRVLLGLPSDVPVVPEPHPELALGPGDDGGMF